MRHPKPKAKSTSTPKAGIFARLSNPRGFKGTGATSRRTPLLVLAALLLAIVVVLGAASALAAAPALTLEPVTDVAITNAEVHGTVDPGGEPTTYYIQFTPQAAYEAEGFGSETQSPIIAGLEGSGPQPVGGVIGGMRPDTEYRLRLYAENGSGNQEVVEAATFTTQAATAPAAHLNAPAAVSYQRVHLSATIDPEGGNTNPGEPEAMPISWQFQLEKASEPGNWEPAGAGAIEGAQAESTSPIEVTADPTALGPATGYQVRLIVTYAGSEQLIPAEEPTFTTLAVAVPTVSVEPVTTFTATSAHFVGHVDPNAPEPHGSTSPAEEEAFATTWHFECTPACPGLVGGEIEADDSAHEVGADAAGLLPHTTYEVTLTAENHGGPETAGPVSFATPAAAATITGTSAADVASTSADLSAQIDPGGSPTTYAFQYTTTDFTECGTPANPACLATAPAGPLPADNSTHEVSTHLQGLVPATTYQYRLVAENGIGQTQGAPLAFTTQGATAASLLPDGRGWELVSPPDKHGALLFGLNDLTSAGGGAIQAAASGDALTYLANAPTELDPAGNANETQVLSARGPSGWSSRDLNPAHEAPSRKSSGFGNEYQLFSADLSLGLIEPQGSFTASLSPAASEQTPYLHTNFPASEPGAFCTESCYRPILTGCPAEPAPCPPAVQALADVPPGTKVGGAVEGATPDLRHIFISSPVALTSTPLPPVIVPGEEVTSLYGYSAAAPPQEALRLLSLLPDGEAVRGDLAGWPEGVGSHNTAAQHTVSTDGSRVFWIDINNQKLYLRYNATQEQSQVTGGECTEPAKACTVEIHDSGGFVAASADGSKVLLGDGCLYNIAAAACQPDLTQGQSGFLYLAASEDLSSVYFADAAVLTGSEENANHEHAEAGGNNLYAYHAGETRFIATLSADDGPDFGALYSRTSRVSPDGDWLAFMSNRSLTGYDNRDVASGQPDEEAYLYHAAAGGAGQLICASCNPTGARPRGVESGFSPILGAGINLPLVRGNANWGGSTWLAADLPGWTEYKVNSTLTQSRYLSDSGRLFFNSLDALVPQDANGNWDVYEYEPPGVGACTESSPTYNPASEGCAGLISSGASKSESAFLDASETGDDVFFLTNSRLTPNDIDGAYDVYDARVGGGEAATAKPVECQGDACQPPAVPPNHPTPGTALLNGPGNAVECPKGKVLKAGKCVKHHQKKKGKKHKKGKHKNANKKKGSSKGKKQKRAAGHNGRGQK